MPKGHKINYSDEEFEWLKDNFTLVLNDYHEQFCKKFNRDDVEKVNLKTLRVRNGWRTGRTGKFYKGQPKIEGSGAKTANSGGFKKGQAPINAKPMFSERVCKDGYTWIKMREKNDGNHRNCFDPKHVVLWEKHNGKTPKGHVIVFLDGDRANIALDNLMCVPRSAIGRLNSRYRHVGKTGEYRKAAIAMSLIDEKTKQTKNKLKNQGENMKNLADLNEILFAQLDKLSDDTRTEAQRKADVLAAKEIKGVAMCITQNAALQIQAASLSRASSRTLDRISGISDIKQVPAPAPASKALDVMKDKGLKFTSTSASTHKKSANTLTPRAAARLKNS